MKSFVYENPRLYELMLKIIHGRNLKMRYKLISEEILKNSVLDIGCGTGILEEYLNKEANYLGFDLNKDFIEYGKKRKRNVKMQSILDFDNYEKRDVIVICDILHHLCPNHAEILDKIKIFAKKKIIICEPFIEHKSGILGNIQNRIGLFIDNDGINSCNERSKFGWYSEEELKNFFKNQIKDRKALRLEKIGNDIIAIYEL